MKITIISLLAFLLLSLINNAQENKTVLDILTGSNWKTVFYLNKTDSIICIDTYTRSLQSETGIFWYAKDAISKTQRKFYLSDEPETVFDEDKVGKVFNGKYIISCGDSSSKTTRYKIMKISDTELQLLRVRSSDEVRIGGDPIPTPTIYRAIPKEL